MGPENPAYQDIQRRIEIYVSSNSTQGDNYNDSYIGSFYNFNDADNFNDSSVGYSLDNETDGNNNSSIVETYLEMYKTFYASIHGYASVTVFVFRVLANVINIIVLSRKHMKSSINFILTALAVADMTMVLSYIPLGLTRHWVGIGYYVGYRFKLMVIILPLLHILHVSHALSTWLTVVVAIWRVMHVCYPGSTESWRSLHKARLAIVSTYTACILICIPHYLIYSIQLRPDLKGGMVYFINHTFTYIGKNAYIFIETYVFPLTLKLVPCSLLTALTIILIREIHTANKNRTRLNVRSGKGKNLARTNKMLVVILVLFLLTHFPRALLYILHTELRNKYVSLLVRRLQVDERTVRLCQQFGQFRCILFHEQ